MYSDRGTFAGRLMQKTCPGNEFVDKSFVCISLVVGAFGKDVSNNHKQMATIHFYATGPLSK